MAFQKRSIARITSSPYGTSANGAEVNKYFYATADAVATVSAAGYFNDYRELHVNDIIEVMGVSEGVGDWVLLKVLTVPAGDITTGVLLT